MQNSIYFLTIFNEVQIYKLFQSIWIGKKYIFWQNIELCLYGYDHFESSPYKETQYHFPFTIFISFLAIL